jgi:hypothetical protein
MLHTPSDSHFLKIGSATFYFSSFSGNAAENLTKILQGQRIGTLFHKDAHKWVPSKEVDVREMAVAARDCSRRLQVSLISEQLENVSRILDITKLQYIVHSKTC